MEIMQIEEETTVEQKTVEKLLDLTQRFRDINLKGWRWAALSAELEAKRCDTYLLIAQKGDDGRYNFWAAWLLVKAEGVVD